jgi:hypothetical protein
MKMKYLIYAMVGMGVTMGGPYKTEDFHVKLMIMVVWPVAVSAATMEVLWANIPDEEKWEIPQ